MGFRQFMASQLRRPSGWFGSLVVTRVMNRVNARITDSTIALLEIQPQHGVLEIGFGGGHGLARLAEVVRRGNVAGVDFSDDLARQAQRRFRKEIAQGRLTVQLGDVSRLPYSDENFDRVLTINTIYFWPDTLQGLGEIRRVLKNGGRAAVAIRSKEKMEKYAVTQHGFRLFSADELAELMRQAGFRDIRVEHRDQEKSYDQVIVVGTR
ncbi:MAG: class I SAM-dependent methyltransferase [Terriglobales bacterium]